MRNLIILIAFICLGFCGCCTKPAIEQPSQKEALVNGLTMTIKAPETYVLGNEFNLQVIFKKVSGKDILGFKDCEGPENSGLYTLEINDNLTGEIIKWQSRGLPYAKPSVELHLIKPGETYQTILHLREGSFTPSLKAGQEIAIKCTYKITKDMDISFPYPLDNLSLTSNIITVKVFGEDKTNK